MPNTQNSDIKAVCNKSDRPRDNSIKNWLGLLDFEIQQTGVYQEYFLKPVLTLRIAITLFYLFYFQCNVKMVQSKKRYTLYMDVFAWQNILILNYCSIRSSVLEFYFEFNSQTTDSYLSRGLLSGRTDAYASVFLARRVSFETTLALQRMPILWK